MPSHEDKKDLSHREPKKASISLKATYNKEMECIALDCMARAKDNHPSHEYLVKLKRLLKSVISWKPMNAL